MEHRLRRKQLNSETNASIKYLKFKFQVSQERGQSQVRDENSEGLMKLPVEVLQPAPTTQEGADGFCETGVRVASVEQAESDPIMDMFTSFELPKWARQSSTSEGVSPNQEKRFGSPTRENS